jgi:hypothetical protein
MEYVETYNKTRAKPFKSSDTGKPLKMQFTFYAINTLVEKTLTKVERIKTG